MATRMQQRRGTAAQWTAANPTLAAGEIGFETDTNKFKLGNGSSAWTSLGYFVDASVVFDSSEVQGVVDAAVAALVSTAPGALNTLGELANALNNDANYSVTISNAVGVLTTGAATAANNISTLTSGLATAANNISTLTSGLATTNNTVAALTSTLTSQISNTIEVAANALTLHEADTTSIHGISNTANLVYTNNSALTDERVPTDGSVSAAKLASSAVTSAKIADDAVTSSKILDSAVTSAKIAANTIVNSDINSAAAIDQSKVADLTSDLSAKLSAATAASTYAPLASPALTGTPTAPTAAAATDSTQVATTAFVRAEVAALVNSAGATLDTLGEIATALGNDANLSSTLTTSIGLKAPLASPTFTGTVTVAAAGVAFTDGTQTKEGVPSRTPISEKTDNYTLTLLAERDSLIEVNSASAKTVTIPLNSAVAYPIGSSLDILQTGAGQVTIAGDSGVTVNATPGFKLRTQYSSATLFKRAENTWVVFGDLTA